MAGLAPGEMLLVKAPFRTISGGNEWMWVEIVKWENRKITGILENDPEYIPTLKSWQKVEINQDDVFDYLLYHSDGTTEGNETGAIIEKMWIPFHG